MPHAVRGALAAVLLTALQSIPHSASADVAIGVSINLAPPVLPVYVQPACPDVGYIWTPGYWAYGDEGYYWVPGTWVQPPTVGLLWTPGYWGFVGGAYAWHAGYWGPHVGFYGGVNYGFGYGGVGFEGGEWRGNAFFYNRAVANVSSVTTVNVYNRTVVNNVNTVSFNGGAGGLTARPTQGEMLAEHEHHVGVTPLQQQHEHAALQNVSLRASVNGGHPGIAATAHAGEFAGHGEPAAHPGAGGGHAGEFAGHGEPAAHPGAGGGHGGEFAGHSEPMAHGEPAVHAGAGGGHPGPGRPGGAAHAGPAPRQTSHGEGPRDPHHK
jgi:hypothetical protein